MTPLFSYLLKSMLCSGILFTYYWFALRDRPHHQWNRLYLLAMPLISLLLPLFHIGFQVDTTTTAGARQWVQLLNVVPDHGGFGEQDNLNHRALQGSSILSVVYTSIVFLLLLRMVLTLRMMSILKQNGELVEGGDFRLILTADSRAPFSFFRCIFWNRQTDWNSGPGRQVLEHEIVHVREGHSLDKIYYHIILSLAWCNPFFWMARRELDIVHEYIADRHAVEPGDGTGLAHLLLGTAFVGQELFLANHFFRSPIKRRLMMIMKNHARHAGLIGRWMALPLLLLIAAAFTLRPEPTKLQKQSGKNIPRKKITVVIDAGHGGSDNGVAISDGTTEKDVALSIARKIRDLNRNDSITILLTRSNDETIDVRRRVDFAKEHHADLFLAIHLNAESPEEPAKKGMQIYVSSRNKAMEHGNTIFGSMLNKELSHIYDVEGVLRKREKGIWVLDAPEINYPAVLLETGFITNDLDRRYILKPENQDNIARAILKTLDAYSEGAEAMVALPEQLLPTRLSGGQPLYVLDGKTIPTPKKLDEVIKPENIESINVLKDENATAKYGSKGKFGVIEITSKKKAAANQ